MAELDLRAIEARYSAALNAKPGKGPYTERGIAALTDSVCDVPELVAEVERLRALLPEDACPGAVEAAADDEEGTVLAVYCNLAVHEHDVVRGYGSPR
jgi:hypothetical protein